MQTGCRDLLVHVAATWDWLGNREVGIGRELAVTT